MYARPTALGILAALTLGLNRSPEPLFTLESTGAVRLHAEGAEARYEVVPLAVRGRSILAVSLGGQTGTGAVYLALPGDRLPAPGRYPIRPSWEAIGSDAAFHASFMAGTPEHPVGWFQGQSGTVTITEAADGRIAGSFQLQARGFLGADPADENQWVTVQGSFTAEGNGMEALVSAQ